MAIPSLIIETIHDSGRRFVIEFVCGDQPASKANDPTLVAVIRCEECIARDFDCDDPEAVATRLAHEALVKADWLIPNGDALRADVLAWLMRHREAASLGAEED